METQFEVRSTKDGNVVFSAACVAREAKIRRISTARAAIQMVRENEDRETGERLIAKAVR